MRIALLIAAGVVVGGALAAAELTKRREPEREFNAPFAFDRLTLTLYEADGKTEEYELLRVPGGAEARVYRGTWDADAEREQRLAAAKSLDAAGYEGLVAATGTCGLRSWDGYSGDGPDAPDGGFAFRAELPGGETLFGHGSGSFPKGFAEFRDLLRGLFQN